MEMLTIASEKAECGVHVMSVYVCASDTFSIPIQHELYESSVIKLFILGIKSNKQSAHALTPHNELREIRIKYDFM